MKALCLVVIYLVSVMLISVALMTATDLPGKYAFSRRFVTAEGSVLNTNCAQHMVFAYEYRVSGVIYTGHSRGQKCNDLKSGGTVTIYYQASEPAISSGLDPRSNFTNDVTAIFFAAFGGGGLILLFVQRARKRHYAG